MERKRGVKGYGKLLFGKDGKVVCHFCGRAFHDLSKHVRQSHDMSADEYREAFGLNHSQSLISEQSREKRRENIFRHPEVIEKLLENGKATTWKKGEKVGSNKKSFQWLLNQKKRNLSVEATKSLMESGRKLGKSGIGNKVRWLNSTGKTKTIEDKAKEFEALKKFERQVG